MLEYKVDPEHEGFRIDRYIKEQNSEVLYSRSLIDTLILNNKVFVNTRVCLKKSHKVKTADIISINTEGIELAGENLPEKEDIPLDIVFEDEYLAIVNKPAGLTVHPGAGNKSGTLVNALLYRYGNQLSQNDIARPGIVHRLDKDTSGLIIITKDNKTHFEMSQLFLNRTIKKTYLCICLGVPKLLEGTIDLQLKRHHSDRTKMSVSNKGRDAITHYTTLADFEYFSLLEVLLQTGRTHQIRVHLEAINLPILADNVYNSTKRTLGGMPLNKQSALKVFLNKHLNRQALHAWKLDFVHPFTKEEMHFEAPLPADITATIDFFKKNYYFNNYKG